MTRENSYQSGTFCKTSWKVWILSLISTGSAILPMV